MSKISELKKVLGQGKVSFVLIFADWCGHCHTFMKNVWGPSCKTPAIHNRIAVREDMLPKTPLANANITGFPSIIVVDEKGDIQNFKGPEGPTNAIPNRPKTVEEMNQMVNVSLKPADEAAIIDRPLVPEKPIFEPEVPANRPSNTGTTVVPTPEPIAFPSVQNNTRAINNALATPNGKTYKPANFPKQMGGSLYKQLKSFIKTRKL